MLKVIRNHRRAAHGEAAGYEFLSITPVPLDIANVPQAASSPSVPSVAWDRALALGEEHGYRNAQATVIAPTGTIGLVMDCDTTGIEPDFALVKFKKLAGGGYFQDHQPRRARSAALPWLPRGIRDRRNRGLCGRAHGTMGQAPAINHGLPACEGLDTDDKLAAIEAGSANRPSTSSSYSTVGRSGDDFCLTSP